MTFMHIYTDGMLWSNRHDMQSSCGIGKLDNNILFKHLMRRNYLAHYNKIQWSIKGAEWTQLLQDRHQWWNFELMATDVWGSITAGKTFDYMGDCQFFYEELAPWSQLAVSATSALSWASTLYTFPNMFIGLRHFNSVQILILQMTYQQW